MASIGTQHGVRKTWLGTGKSWKERTGTEGRMCQIPVRPRAKAAFWGESDAKVERRDMSKLVGGTARGNTNRQKTGSTRETQ